MDAIKHKFIELRGEGYSFDSIAKKLKKSKVTLIAWSKQLDEEIANRKAIQLETLYEKYFLLKEKKLELFGETLLRLNEELSKRTFESVPTSKLLELVPKYQELLSTEFVDLRFSTEAEMKEAKTEKELLKELANLFPEN